MSTSTRRCDKCGFGSRAGNPVVHYASAGAHTHYGCFLGLMVDREAEESQRQRALMREITERTGCPRCGAEPGVDCRTPKGQRLVRPHKARRKIDTEQAA